MIIECQYKNGEWKTFKFKRLDLFKESFRDEEGERPVKIKAKVRLTTPELDYLSRYVDFRSDIKIIQE